MGTRENGLGIICRQIRGIIRNQGDNGGIMRLGEVANQNLVSHTFTAMILWWFLLSSSSSSSPSPSLREEAIHLLPRIHRESFEKLHKIVDFYMPCIIVDRTDTNRLIDSLMISPPLIWLLGQWAVITSHSFWLCYLRGQNPKDRGPFEKAINAL